MCLCVDQSAGLRLQLLLPDGVRSQAMVRAVIRRLAIHLQRYKDQLLTMRISVTLFVRCSVAKRLSVCLFMCVQRGGGFQQSTRARSGAAAGHTRQGSVLHVGQPLSYSTRIRPTCRLIG